MTHDVSVCFASDVGVRHLTVRGIGQILQVQNHVQETQRHPGRHSDCVRHVECVYLHVHVL